jgi:hypothetical protein
MTEATPGEANYQENDEGDVVPTDAGIFPTGRQRDREIPHDAPVYVEAGSPSPAAAVPKGRKRPFELPGKNGRTNNIPNPQPHEAQRGLTDAEIEARRESISLGAAAARAMLDPNSQN